MRTGELHVPIEVFEVRRHVPAADLSTLPNTSGAYVLGVASGLRYVGSSKTLRSRVLAHRVANDPNIREPIRSACCYLTRTHVDARILERWLIREVRPALNRAHALPAAGRCRCERACEACIDVRVAVEQDTGELPPDRAGELPDAPGAYVIACRSGKRYVGHSTLVRSRVRAHLELAPGGHVSEPVRSVRAYLARDEVDAPLLEYALIRELAPELNREFRPDASTWKPGDLDALFARANPALRELFDALDERVAELPGARRVVRRSWVTFQTGPMRNFCAVRVCRTCLQVDLKRGGQALRDRHGLCCAIEPTQAWTFDGRIELSDTEQLDAAFDLVEQAYARMGLHARAR